ncbi:MAG TPA: trypsin-like serine protease [Iamia sp.]
MTTTHATLRWGARSTIAVAMLAATVVGLVAPATAATDEPRPTGTTATAPAEVDGPRIADRRDGPAEDGRPDSRIVGGTTAPADAYPSQAGLILRGYTTFQGQFCGGTVIDRSWILTAAHCVRDPASDWAPTPGEIDVLVGSQDLGSGGTRIRAVEFRIHPGWNRELLRNDVALIRLDHPVPATTPIQALAPAGGPPAAGTIETAVGWGDMFDSAGAFPEELRHVDLVAQTSVTCRSVFGAIYDPTSHICAWASGKGTCQGDSGGPLYVDDVQVGIVSWGAVCGEHPSVFARISTYSTWIRWQVRYGPQPNASAFVRRQYLDLFGRQPSNTELFYGVAALEDGKSTAAFVAELLDGSTFRARSGGVIRLYKAIFLREPDSGGLTFWMGEINRGVSLRRIADLMVRAPEFEILYGELDDAGFVDLVYDNVLERDPSPTELDYWVDELSSGRRTRGQVMVGFSESQEYRDATDPTTSVTAAFWALVRRVPTPTEMTQWLGDTTGDTARFLLTSWTYANRF